MRGVQKKSKNLVRFMFLGEPYARAHESFFGTLMSGTSPRTSKETKRKEEEALAQ